MNAGMKAKQAMGLPSVFRKVPKEFEHEFMRKSPETNHEEKEGVG
jgi:hypothetical protein